MQEGGEENQEDRAGFTADSDSGWDSFGSAEEAWREAARAPKTEAKWKQEGRNPWTDSSAHCQKNRDTQPSEFEIQSKDFSLSLSVFVVPHLSSLCFLFCQKSSKEKSWEELELSLERHIQKAAPYVVSPTETLDTLHGPVNVSS